MCANYCCFAIVLSLLCAVNGAASPALIWGTSNAPARNELEQSEFRDLLSTALKDSMVMVFIENELLPEDLTLCKKDSGVTCFENLSKNRPRFFYSRAEKVLKTARDSSENVQFTQLGRNGETEEPIDYEVGKVVFLDLQNHESVEELTQQFIEHDSSIAKIFEKLSTSGNILAVYTSAESEHVRNVREVEKKVTPKEESKDKNKNSLNFNVDGKFFIYYNELLEYEVKGEKITYNQIQLTEDSLKSKEQDSYEIVLTTKDSKSTLSFIVETSVRGYWKVHNFIYNDKPLTVKTGEIYIPRHFSYYCSNTTLAISGEKGLHWNGLQIQPNFEKAESSAVRFEDAWHCVGFTSAPIWSGLFVVFMLLAIIAVAICWMLDINTMDRFDDPKGKTITINVTE